MTKLFLVALVIKKPLVFCYNIELLLSQNSPLLGLKLSTLAEFA